jgi:hypothetical protein
MGSYAKASSGGEETYANLAHQREIKVASVTIQMQTTKKETFKRQSNCLVHQIDKNAKYTSR